MAYECATCESVFENLEELGVHCRVNNHAMCECLQCKQIFQNECLLDHHYRTCSAHAFCKQCHRPLQNPDALCHHLNTSESAVHLFCKKHKQTFQDAQTSREHSPYHFFCHLCDQKFPDEFELRRHLRHSPSHSISGNGNAPTSQAEQCQTDFTQSKTLKSRTSRMFHSLKLEEGSVNMDLSGRKRVLKKKAKSNEHGYR